LVIGLCDWRYILLLSVSYASFSFSSLLWLSSLQLCWQLPPFRCLTFSLQFWHKWLFSSQSIAVQYCLVKANSLFFYSKVDTTKRLSMEKIHDKCSVSVNLVGIQYRWLMANESSVLLLRVDQNKPGLWAVTKKLTSQWEPIPQMSLSSDMFVPELQTETQAMEGSCQRNCESNSRSKALISQNKAEGADDKKIYYQLKKGQNLMQLYMLFVCKCETTSCCFTEVIFSQLPVFIW